MTRPPQPTDAQLDDLLDQALAAGDVPAELQGRVLALTDPAFNAQLDAALAPDALPDGLESRVLGRVHAQLEGQHDPVLATVGLSARAWLGYAAAAAVVLATGLVFYFVAGHAATPGDAPGPIANQTPNDNDPTPAEIEAALAFNEDSELDQRISSLESRILSVSDEPIWGGDDDFQRELWLELTPDDTDEGLLF